MIESCTDLLLVMRKFLAQNIYLVLTNCSFNARRFWLNIPCQIWNNLQTQTFWFTKRAYSFLSITQLKIRVEVGFCKRLLTNVVLFITFILSFRCRFLQVGANLVQVWVNIIPFHENGSLAFYKFRVNENFMIFTYGRIWTREDNDEHRFDVRRPFIIRHRNGSFAPSQPCT